MRVGIPAPALGSPPRALGRSPSPMSMPPVPKKEEKQGPKKKKKGKKKISTPLKPQALQQFAGFESDSRKRSLSNLWENTRMTRKLKGNCSMNKCYYRAPNPNP